MQGFGTPQFEHPPTFLLGGGGAAAGWRAEVVALSLVLSVEAVAKHGRAAAVPGRRTPDWHVDLEDGRSIAIEVTCKQTEWHYDVPPIQAEGWLRATSEKYLIPGHTDTFQHTVSQKMRDKHQRGQLNDPAREAWLGIYLDDDSGIEMEQMLQTPPPTDPSTTSQGWSAVSTILDEAAGYGFSEVWCFASAGGGTQSILVLRLLVLRREWVAWQQRPEFCWFPDGSLGGAIGSIWPVTPPKQLLAGSSTHERVATRVDRDSPPD